MAETKTVLVNDGGAPARILNFTAAAAISAGEICGIDSNGNVIYNLQDPSPNSFSPITSVEEENGLLYLGSLDYPGIGYINRPQ